MFANIPLIINLAESEQLSWDMAKQIIQSQHTLAIYGITAVVGVAAVLLVFSLIWNVFLRRHELQRATESLRQEITTKIKEDFAKLTERFKDEIAEMKKEIEKSVEERMTQFDKTVEKRMVLFNAEKARLFALVCEQRNWWATAASWWATAIVNYTKVKDQRFIRIATDLLNEDLKKCEQLEDEQRENIKKCLSSIPETLETEKVQIEDRLDKLSTN